MKSAQAILEELATEVQPRPGCAIVLTEWKLSGQNDQNWVPACGNMDAEKLRRFNKKIVELLRTDPVIDWSGVETLVKDQRRIAHWMLSEVDDS